MEIIKESLHFLNEATSSTNYDENRVYRNNVELPISKKNKYKGNLMFVISPNLDTTIKAIDSPGCMVNNYYTGYYFDKFITRKFGNVTKKIRFKEKERWTEVRSKSDRITRSYLNIDKYNGFNTFVDLSDYHILFFSNLLSSKTRNLDGYMSMIDELVNSPKLESKLYQDKYILFPLNAWIDSTKDATNYRYTTESNPFIFIAQTLRDNPAIIKALPKIVFYSNTGWFIFNINTIEKGKEFNTFKTLTMKLDDSSTDEIDAEVELPESTPISQKTEMISNTIVGKLELGDDITSSVVNKRVEAITNNISEEDLKNIDDIIDNIDGDTELVKILQDLKANQLEASPARLAREKMLREKFNDINVNGESVSSILKRANDTKIEKVKIDADVIDKSITTNTLINFDEEYVKKQKMIDTINIVNSFTENKSIPMSIVDMKIEDASDEFNLVEQLTVVFEDRKGKRHNLKILLPIIQDGMFMHLMGSDKNLIKQLTLKPVVKTKPDTVQFSTSYNKMFIYRHGKNISSRMIRFKEALKSIITDKIKLDFGNYQKANAEMITTMEFDELASDYSFIEYDGCHVSFNLPNLYDKYKDKTLEHTKMPENTTLIGYMKNGEFINLDFNTNKVFIDNKPTDKELLEFLIDGIIAEEPAFKDRLLAIKVPNKYMYSRAKLMGEYVPIIILCAYSEGLTTVLNKAQIKYEVLEDVYEKYPDIDKRDDLSYIEFADSFLVYNTFPYENSLLMNGLTVIDTKSYNFSDMNDKLVYLDMFIKLFGSSNKAHGFDNFYELMIDPITLDILKDLKLPTDYVSVLLYANALLVDNKFFKETDFNVCRLRCSEIINAMLYKQLSTAYEGYKRTAINNNPLPMTVKPDSLITNLITQPIVEEYSSLNPILEAERARTIGYKGPSGINLEQSYTLDKRTMEPSMMGSVAITSPPSGKVGITRQLCIDAEVLSTRGYFNTDVDPNTLGTKNLMSPGEGLIPFATNHDDSPRISMATTQQKHVVAIDDADVFSVTNGVDKIMHRLVTDKFCYKAKKDGKVVEIDEKNELMIIEYTDGSKDVIRTNREKSKNSGGGFYIINQLTPAMKLGDTFKKDAVLAYNDKYFKKDLFGNLTFVSNAVVNVALLTGYYTYEDSTAITERLANRLATDVIMSKTVTLSPNANIQSIVKVGEKVKVGSPLIVFEENTSDDPEISKLFDRMGEDMQEGISELGRSTVKSSYAGEVHDITIYYTCEEDLMTPTLQQLIKDYKGRINKVKRKIDANIGEQAKSKIMIPPSGKVSASKGKVKGEYLENGVMIEFFIKYRDIMSIGDKLTYYTALKGIVGEVIPFGKEPHLLRDKEEKIDAFLSHISIDARMVVSIIISGALNKALYELKKKLKKDWES